MRTTRPMTSNGVSHKHDLSGPRTGRLPDFLIIGAMKAGTTTLYHHLANHPAIFMCEPKEPQFFSRSEVYEHGLDWYRNLFRSAEPGQVRGEASTCYSRWPHHGNVPERIARMNPDARLIYLMRHPVERCYSHYGHRMQEWARRGKTVISFAEYLHHDAEAIDASLYMRQIERYLLHFSREQFLFLIFDDLIADPASTMHKVFRFLGQMELSEGLHNFSAANARGSKFAKSRVTRTLHAIRSTWGIRRIADCLPTAARRQARRQFETLLISSYFGRMISKRFNHTLSPLTNEMRAQLLQRFERPTRDLEHFLGHPLPHWHT